MHSNQTNVLFIVEQVIGQYVLLSYHLLEIQVYTDFNVQWILVLPLAHLVVGEFADFEILISTKITGINLFNTRESFTNSPLFPFRINLKLTKMHIEL